jgi:hypothetical protein
MTDRDAYWGAKVVTSFTDAQISALVAAARLGEPDASFLEHALRVRRDILGRRYLRVMAAVEDAQTSADGANLCFDDLAIARGYASAAETRYLVGVSDGLGKVLASFERASDGPRACLPLGSAEAGSGYRIVEIRTRLAGGARVPGSQTTKATRVHLRWRSDARRFVVVGLERDE